MSSSEAIVTALNLPILASITNADVMDPRPTVVARCGQRRDGPLSDFVVSASFG